MLAISYSASQRKQTSAEREEKLKLSCDSATCSIITTEKAAEAREMPPQVSEKRRRSTISVYLVFT